MASRFGRTNGQSEGERSEDEFRDLGFGSVVMQESRERLLNRDGSFNVYRRRLGFWSSLSVYHALLTMAWWQFLSLSIGFYLLANALFAFAYMMCGPDALNGGGETDAIGPFFQAFFFSVHTLATIGYGNVSPVGMGANMIVVIESLVGLVGFALVTGLVFARFSRPTAGIIFSHQAVIAPYRANAAFEFRIANQRSNELIEVTAKVIFSRFEDSNGRRVRRFHELALERRSVTFFPLAWTIVHPINEGSPLCGLTEQDFHEDDVEFLILLSGIDETFAQTVHARSSYKADEIVWNARFANIFNRPTRNRDLTIDIERIHDIQRIE